MVTVKPLDKETLAMLQGLGSKKKKQNTTSGKRKAQNKSKRGASGKLFPLRNSPEWYTRKGSPFAMVNFGAPDSSVTSLWRTGNYGRIDFIAQMQNTLPAGQVWDASMAELMSALRARAAATQLYTVTDLKLYMLKVREAFSLATWIKRAVQAFNYSSVSDTAGPVRYPGLAGVAASALDAWRSQLATIRGELMTQLNAILPYVPKGMPFFERAAHLYGNFFKDAPSKKGSAFAPGYLPTWWTICQPPVVTTLEPNAADLGTGASIDFSMKVMVNNGTETTGLGFANGASHDCGFGLGDIVGYPFGGRAGGSPAVSGKANEGPVGALSWFSASGRSCALQYLQFMVSDIVGNEAFGLIRGDLARVYEMWDASAAVQAITLKPEVVYDRLTSLQFHNANPASHAFLPTGAAAPSGEEFVTPSEGVISIDHGNGGCVVGPHYYVSSNVAAPSLGAYVHKVSPGCDANRLVGFANSVEFGTEAYFADGYGIDDTVNPNVITSSKTQVVDIDTDGVTPGELLEITRLKHTMPIGPTSVVVGTNCRLLKFTNSGCCFGACGTDVFLEPEIIYAVSGDKYQSETTKRSAVPQYASLMAKWTMGPLFWLRVSAWKDDSGASITGRGWRLAGDTYNVAPVGSEALEALLNQGTQSVLTL